MNSIDITSIGSSEEEIYVNDCTCHFKEFCRKMTINKIICFALSMYFIFAYITILLSLLGITKYYSYMLVYLCFYAVDTIILTCTVYVTRLYSLIYLCCVGSSIFTMFKCALSRLDDDYILIHFQLTWLIIIIHFIIIFFMAFESIRIIRRSMIFMYILYCLHLPLTICVFG